MNGGVDGVLIFRLCLCVVCGCVCACVHTRTRMSYSYNLLRACKHNPQYCASCAACVHSLFSRVVAVARCILFPSGSSALRFCCSASLTSLKDDFPDTDVLQSAQESEPRCTCGASSTIICFFSTFFCIWVFAIRVPQAVAENELLVIRTSDANSGHEVGCICSENKEQSLHSA